MNHICYLGNISVRPEHATKPAAKPVRIICNGNILLIIFLVWKPVMSFLKIQRCHVFKITLVTEMFIYFLNLAYNSASTGLLICFPTGNCIRTASLFTDFEICSLTVNQFLNEKVLNYALLRMYNLVCVYISVFNCIRLTLYLNVCTFLIPLS